ncbi:hypothetical protein [Methanothrix sp.]|uniref:hypothetical protein n=2 Tax=Methanothrix sp. TaxID=90426 RepID=UPI001BD5F5A5
MHSISFGWKQAQRGRREPICNMLREAEVANAMIIDFEMTESLANTLKAYAVRTSSSSQDHSQIVEAALIEFFERRGIKVDT